MSDLNVGVAEVDFTPPPGLPLMGHSRDDYAARDTHDPIRARALVVANAAGARAALLTLDLCMLNRAQARMMREYIGARSEVSPENILIAATHTHGGPAPFSIYGAPAASAAEVERFLKQAAEAVIQADKRLKPVIRGHREMKALPMNLPLRGGCIPLSPSEGERDRERGPCFRCGSWPRCAAIRPWRLPMNRRVVGRQRFQFVGSWLSRDQVFTRMGQLCAIM
jgi:hypothetical protein